MVHKRTILSFLAITSLLAAAAVGSAHDFWLVPEFFRAPSGWHLHVYANTGERFPESSAALAPDRVAHARLVGARATHPIERMRRVGNSLVLEAPRATAGQWYVALEVEPRRIDLTAEQFNEYLVHDGLPHILELRRERGELDVPGRERYSRGAKALLTAGEGGPPIWDRVLGHPIELVPQSDPTALRPGDTLSVRLLFNGEPAVGDVVAAGHADHEGHVAEARTDRDGIARLPITAPGRWYLRTIHMIERPDAPDFDWESFWATLTFQVEGE